MLIAHVVNAKTKLGDKIFKGGLLAYMGSDDLILWREN